VALQAKSGSVEAKSTLARAPALRKRVVVSILLLGRHHSSILAPRCLSSLVLVLVAVRFPSLVARARTRAAAQR
jgi:hypothetical protein